MDSFPSSHHHDINQDKGFQNKTLVFICFWFWAPIWKRFSALSDGLISIVQEETLDESWIPVTEKEWREQQDSENEYITKKVMHSS